MESDDSSPCPGRKKRLIHFDDTSSDSDSDFGIQTLAQRNRRNVINDSDSSSDSSIDLIPRKKSKPATMIDSDTSSSGSDIVFKKRGVSKIPSDDESYESDWSESYSKPGSSMKPSITNDGSSSDSDGQSDKCPICLISFKNQEVGSPESCDHSFCAECILEWSKNVNTCPVDRQPFTLVLVRSKYNGKVIRQVPVEPAAQQNNEDEVVDDPTFCEICGSCDREDRLLLCDGCDLGFHLECLTPPLEDVPTVAWFCSDCDPDDPPDVSVYLEEVQFLLDGAEDILRSGGSRRRNTRLVPRTRQSERVRSRILTNRTRNRTRQNDIQEEIQVVVSQNAGPSTSRRRKRMTKKRKSSKNSKIKITYDLDKDTGQQIVIETKTCRYKRKKKKSKKARVAAKPKTVKKRLAVQLGMCASRSNGQSLPDVRVSSENSRIGFQRSQAAIPALHLFGRRQELDYFSDSDIESNDGGVGILTARRPNMSDVALFRRNASRKNILIESSSASCDLLGSIMDSQEKFHSKNTVLSLRKDGTIQVNEKGKQNIVNNNSNERVNLNDYSRVHVRHTPLCSDSTSPTTGSGSPNHSENYRNSVNAVSSASTISNDSVSTSSGNDHIAPSHNNYSEQPNYSVFPSCSGDVPEKKNSDSASPQSESELDLYSDIETVSTSKVEDTKTLSPAPEAPLNMQSDDEANNSDTDLVIDTEKADEKSSIPEEYMETKEEAVSSTTNVSPKCDDHVHKSDEEDADSEDGCPNFSIYSAESINLAKSTDVGLLNQEPNVGSSLDIVDSAQPPSSHNDEMSTAQECKEDEHPEEPPEPPETPEPEDMPAIEATPSLNEVATPQEEILEKVEEECSITKPDVVDKQSKLNDHTELYSDSDDEIVKVNAQKPFGIGDIRSMTEDISEEERSYTPCLDERAPFGEGLDGLDTEAISDEEKNDFDESHELKTASDGGDALEINAKECELDFSKPEEYEEGEIIDKLKKLEEAKKAQEKNEQKEVPEDKENQNKESASFKKISKSNKDRNYRDKERDKSRSASKENERSKRRDRKKEKRKEIERYNIRTVLAEKPRRLKDKFGRDRRSRTKSSRSRSISPPYRSVSRGRRSHSKEKSRKRRPRTTSRSRSRRRSRSRHRRRSLSKTRPKKRRSRERSKNRRKNRSASRRRSRSNSPKRRRDWERRSRGWSPSPSRSRSPMTPSWTPPRLLEKQPVKPHNLTVILTNDSSKKKKDRKKGDKKKKDAGGDKQKKRRRDKTPPPSKEVFASGDNILVSVSFNDEREREATVKRKRDDDVSTKRTRKEKTRRARSPKARKKKRHDLSGVKPVAIIDLDRSPFKELTPSPKDVIILTDSENGETRQDNVCDSSQQADPYPTGPKTPPEPQVKFSLTAKPAQLRAITNPLHEPDDMDGEMDPQEELEQRLNDTLHKGPNTPPEPPNSPPSSPDAYDPFDPTKSRSPTPENISVVQSSMAQSTDNNHDESSEILDKSNLPLVQTPDVSHTPPVVPDVQPADSQSNASATTPDINGRKSPERSIAVVINQVVQSQPSIFPTLSKSVAQPSYSSAPLVTSTPISTNLSVSRINILNSTILAPSAVMSSVPQRIVLPTTTKSSPIKVSPTKPPIKSTPIKPMPNKSIAKPTKTPMRKTNARNNNDGNDSTLEFDSPYSPGPSDYEDLFEPPSEPITKASKPKPATNNKSVGKNQNTFDALFGSSPVHKVSSKSKTFDKKKKPSGNSKGTKMVGVKIDEDSLKILDDVPNSAVEMQVKDKFLKKLNRQERVVEEVKLVLKPHYNKKHINKEEYKDILRRAVPKICHNRSGEINPKKIQNLIEAYVKKVRHSKKVTSSSSVNPQKAN